MILPKITNQPKATGILCKFNRSKWEIVGKQQTGLINS